MNAVGNSIAAMPAPSASAAWPDGGAGGAPHPWRDATAEHHGTRTRLDQVLHLRADATKGRDQLWSGPEHQRETPGQIHREHPDGEASDAPGAMACREVEGRHDRRGIDRVGQCNPGDQNSET